MGREHHGGLRRVGDYPAVRADLGLAQTSVFAWGKNLGAGRIYFARAFKSVRDPIRPWPDGHKAHIGEVQVSMWDENTMAACDASGIILL